MGGCASRPAGRASHVAILQGWLANGARDPAGGARLAGSSDGPAGALRLSVCRASGVLGIRRWRVAKAAGRSAVIADGRALHARHAATLT